MIAIVALALLASASAASGDTFVVVRNVVLPSATEPNPPGLVVPDRLESRPARRDLRASTELGELWEHAGAAYGVPSSVLAAIAKLESDFGRDPGPSETGALGSMQFLPDTWLAWGVDADGDGVADPWNTADAVHAAARYLAASGADSDLRAALDAYDGSSDYADEVLELAALYERGGDTETRLDVQSLDVTAARQDVNGVRLELAEARTEAARLAARARELRTSSASAQLISDRLAGQMRAASSSVEADQQGERVEALRRDLAEAEATLERTRTGALAAPVEPVVAGPVNGPQFSGAYAFPVAGGAALVSVGAATSSSSAQIAAPAGTLVYALADGSVASTSTSPEGACGLGLTLQTTDGRRWVYCHLAYLDAAVTTGASLRAGALVGLVGKTGDAASSQLGLQLDPATSAPQGEDWFRALGGSAFRWEGDAPAAGPPALAVPAASTAPTAQAPAPVGIVPTSLFVGYSGTPEQLGRLVAALQQAASMGLRVGENTLYDSIDPVHTSGSYHYQLYPGTGVNRGADISGPAETMAAFYTWAKAVYGAELTELFYDPLGGIKHGGEIGPIGNHSDHVHIAF